MRVVYLSTLGQLGGAETSLLEIMASVRKAHPEWYLFLIAAQPGPLVERAATLGVATSVLELPPAIAGLGDAAFGGPAGRRISLPTFCRRAARAGAALPGYLRRMRRELSRLSPHVIHANGCKMHLIGAWSRPEGTPVIWHIHDYVQQRPVMRRLLQMSARRCAAAVANSQSVADDVRQVCGTALTVCRVYNAIDLDRFHPRGSALDLDRMADMASAPDGTIRVGLLATFARWKGHEVFLRALASLPETLRVRGYVIGGPVYQSKDAQHSFDELRQMARELDVERRIGFTGPVNDPEAALRSLDIAVHASTEPEPFGLVIAEAMACGRAVIVSKAGGAAELFSDCEDAIGAAPRSAKELAAAIQRLAEDQGLRSRLGIAARHTAEQRFDRKRLALELAPIYQSVGARI